MLQFFFYSVTKLSGVKYRFSTMLAKRTNGLSESAVKKIERWFETVFNAKKTPTTLK